MSIDGMFEKYGDEYILNHPDGNKYVRWGAIEKTIDSVKALESKLSASEQKLADFITHQEKMCHDYTDRINGLHEKLAEAEKLKKIALDDLELRMKDTKRALDAEAKLTVAIKALDKYGLDHGNECYYGEGFLRITCVCGKDEALAQIKAP